jgi:hypothetical protein
MASTIITKNSSTASAIPAVGDLTKGELAVNVTDKKVYTKDNSAAIVKIVGSLGNQEANAVAITGGSIAGITDLAVADGGTGASTASDARTNLGLGTIATQAASSVTITGGSVTGITDITVADGGTGASTAANARSNLGAAASGANSDITSLSGLTTALSVAQGGTGITSFGSGVATFLGTPSSANLLAAVTDETGTGALVFANTPTLVAPILGTPTSGNFSTGTFTWPTFNQNTTGTAAGLSATLAIASGGTGQTTANAAFNALAPSQTSASGKYLKSNGTNTSWDDLDISTADITGTLPVANGGTGITSFGTGVATFLGTPSSANLAAAVTGETGSGALVFATSPTLVTPVLGVATGTSFQGIIGNVTPATGNFTTLTENSVATVIQTDIGTGANEIPLNQYLGNLAYQDASSIAGPMNVGGALSSSTSKVTTTTAVGNATPSTSGSGITFPATQSASSDANTLDDYEEGTWTPTLTFDTAGDLSVVYSVRAGIYTKIGRQVFCQFWVVATTFTYTTASGNFNLTGLPFTVLSTTANTNGTVGSYRGLTLKTLYSSISSEAQIGTSTCLFLQTAYGTSALAYTNTAEVITGNQKEIRMQFSYVA